MPTPERPLVRRVVARNDAEESENAIHHDDVAPRYGFHGGLVPGVTVYAYLSALPVARWGPDWLERGTMSVRLALPVYDGEDIDLRLVPDGDDAADLQACGPDGSVRATGRATMPGPHASAEPPAVPPAVALPERHERPQAGGDVLAAIALGSYDRRWTSGSQVELLHAIGEDPAEWPYPDLAHPGWLIRGANDVLSRSVRLGPWMHVSSEVTHHTVVTRDQLVSTRGRVVGLFERKGHRFVDLDVVVLADGRPAWSVRHVAIYEPRPVSSGSDAIRS